MEVLKVKVDPAVVRYPKVPKYVYHVFQTIFIEWLLKIDGFTVGVLPV
jgi:hypothetical protein